MMLENGDVEPGIPPEPRPGASDRELLLEVYGYVREHLVRFSREVRHVRGVVDAVRAEHEISLGLMSAVAVRVGVTQAEVDRWDKELALIRRRVTRSERDAALARADATEEHRSADDSHQRAAVAEARASAATLEADRAAARLIVEQDNRRARSAFAWQVIAGTIAAVLVAVLGLGTWYLQRQHDAPQQPPVKIEVH